jgi:hypothetical protein
MAVSETGIFTLTTESGRGGCDPWRVVVRDDAEKTVVEMCAITLAHARQIAESLALLIGKQRPGGRVVFAPDAMNAAGARC